MRVKRLFLFLASAFLALSGCSAQKTEDVTYSFSFTAQNGMPLISCGVSLRKGGKVIARGASDGLGNAEVLAPEGTYDIVYDLPLGYDTDAVSRTAVGEHDYEVDCVSSVIPGEAPENYFYSTSSADKMKYELYDVMYDFSFTIYDGSGATANPVKDIRLSDLLKEKKAVLLNFWYITCSWCIKEMPYLSAAYDDYADDIEILALDYYDTPEDIYAFREEGDYHFDMCYDSLKMLNAFEIGAFPTSVLIDRYGMIVLEMESFASYKDACSVFAKYTADDYVPTYKEDSDTPDIPDVTGASMEDIAKTANAEGCKATYHDETDEEDALYNWPWIINDRERAIQPSNAGHDSSYSILYMDIPLGKDEVLAFDYRSSSESGGDILYVLEVSANESRILKKISGVDESYSLCELYVSAEEGNHEFAFCFCKDSSSLDGDDTVYIRNVRTYPVSEIVNATYVLRSAASGNYDTKTGKFAHYVTPVLNEEDGYYHVGSADGQLLLADLLGTTNFDSSATVYTTISTYDMLDDDGNSINSVLMKYCTLAGNTLKGYVPVTEELRDYLDRYVKIRVSNEENSVYYEEEWLELCYYFDNYGTDIPFTDPTIGLSEESAITARLGEENYATFDRTLIPRGLKYVFTAPQSGVYHFYAVTDTSYGSHAWYFDTDGNQLTESLFDERIRYFAVDDPIAAMDVFHDYLYLDEGETIYLNVGFDDIYCYSTLQWGIEYAGEEVSLFRFCSPGYYTSAINENGEVTGEIISTGIRTVLAEDGYYHELLEDGTAGSLIYADFTYGTNLLDHSILDCLNNSLIRDPEGNDPFDFTEVGDHDRTADFRAYLSKISSSDEPHGGCVPVDEDLRVLLQLISAKYGFDVEGGWEKMCYYYDTISANNRY